MISKTQKASIDKCEMIQLGRIGENLFRTVEIDVSVWRLKDATYSLIFVRPDKVAYAVPITYTDNTLLWIPTGYDTAVAGDGYCEVRASIGEARGKSAIFKVRIDKSITANAGEPAVVAPDWLDDILNAVVIQSIGQTETSNADGGMNIFTVTLTNGETAEFEVKNGTRGEKGEQGIKGEKGDKGERGEQGPRGEQGIKGATGERGEQGVQGVRGERGEQGIQGIQGERGYSGLLPKQIVPYASSITVPANTMTEIATLEGNITISLGAEAEGYDNEWNFDIEQGSTAYTVTLPQVEWTLGIAPTFGADSTTEVRLHYKGNTLQGVWY